MCFVSEYISVSYIMCNCPLREVLLFITFDIVEKSLQYGRQNFSWSIVIICAVKSELHLSQSSIACLGKLNKYSVS